MDATNPLVSVIIPNYNHASYLDERIASVLGQTYRNYELIILDDKSTDDSIKVIEKYRSHPKVSHIVINDENSGSTFIQWDRGLSLAKGELIWIAESDDYCAASLLNELVAAYKQHPSCSIVFCMSLWINSEGEPIGERLPDNENVFMNGLEFIKRHLSYESFISNASSAIFPKRLALLCDKAYMEYRAGGDRRFWIEMAESGDVCFVRKQLNYFRRHEQSVTKKRNHDGIAVKEAKRTFDYLNSKGYLGTILRVCVLSFYRERVFTMNINSEDTRKELFSTWGCTPLNKYPSHLINTSRLFLVAVRRKLMKVLRLR